MDTRVVNWICVFLVIAVMALAMIDVTFDFKLFVHDFSEVKGDKTVFRWFMYHFGLMLQPAILLFAIVMNTKGFWRRIALYGLLWSLKDCVDVVVNNNRADTFWWDLAGLVTVILITELCVKISIRKLTTA